jgi:chromate transporter
VTLAAVALAAAVALWAAPTAKLVEAVVQGQASVLLIFASGLKAGLLTLAAPTRRFRSFATTPSGADG